MYKLSQYPEISPPHIHPQVHLAFRADSVEKSQDCYLIVALCTPDSHGILGGCPDIQAWLAPRRDD